MTTSRSNTAPPVDELASELMEAFADGRTFPAAIATASRQHGRAAVTAALELCARLLTVAVDDFMREATPYPALYAVLAGVRKDVIAIPRRGHLRLVRP
jgi:hypothetical protein